jgi:hypothetical protein
MEMLASLDYGKMRKKGEHDPVLDREGWHLLLDGMLAEPRLGFSCVWHSV